MPNRTLPEYERTPEGGWIVARTEDFVIDVQPQIVNWRIHICYPEDYGKSYQHGFCYQGRGVRTMLEALKAAHDWANSADPWSSKPEGFIKQAF